jgi:restriction endonuclease S subunit
VTLDRDLDRVSHLKLGEILRFESRSWKPKDFPDGKFRYIEIGAVTKDDGIRSAQLVDVADAPSRATTLVKAGDIILSSTRPYLGAFTIIPPEYDGCVCSSGFALATGLLRDDIDKEFLLLFLRSEAGLKQMERRMTGGLYPAIVQDELEKIRVPFRPHGQQVKTVESYKLEKARIRRALEEAVRRAEKETTKIDRLLLAVSKP